MDAVLLRMHLADAGFDIELPPEGDWVVMGVSGQAMRVWVRGVAREAAGMAASAGAAAGGPAGGRATATDGPFEVAASDADVLDEVWGQAGWLEHPVRRMPGGWPDGARAGLVVRYGDSLPAFLHALRRAAGFAQERSLAQLNRAIDYTEAEALIRQRRGQDLFRARLIQLWSGRYAVTGLAMPELLRASHAKPWKDATDAERLDPCNGLLLAAHLDAVFDQGLVAVGEDGLLLWSSLLGHEDRLRLGVTDGLRVDGLTRAHQPFLAYHRERCFRGN